MKSMANKLQCFTLGLIIFIFTTGILFLFGQIFSISFLMLDYTYVESSQGNSITVTHFLPLIIGLIASYLAESNFRKRLEKHKKKSS